jgi:hypothetical protein
MKNKGQEMGGNVGQAASSAADTVRSTAGQLSDSARDAASHLAKEGRDAASYVGNMAEDATCAVGSGLKSVGQSIREHSPQEGRFGQASSAVARTLEGTGNYLQEEGLKGLGTDLTQMIKNNPLPSLLIGVGLGFLLAQATTPRR